MTSSTRSESSRAAAPSETAVMASRTAITLSWIRHDSMPAALSSIWPAIPAAPSASPVDLIEQRAAGTSLTGLVCGDEQRQVIRSGRVEHLGVQLEARRCDAVVDRLGRGAGRVGHQRRRHRERCRGVEP
jgi:hypothetical protein